MRIIKAEDSHLDIILNEFMPSFTILAIFQELAIWLDLWANSSISRNFLMFFLY